MRRLHSTLALFQVRPRAGLGSRAESLADPGAGNVNLHSREECGSESDPALLSESESRAESGGREERGVERKLKAWWSDWEGGASPTQLQANVEALCSSLQQLAREQADEAERETAAMRRMRAMLHGEAKARRVAEMEVEREAR